MTYSLRMTKQNVVMIVPLFLNQFGFLSIRLSNDAIGAIFGRGLVKASSGYATSTPIELFFYNIGLVFMCDTYFLNWF